MLLPYYRYKLPCRKDLLHGFIFTLIKYESFLQRNWIMQKQCEKKLSHADLQSQFQTIHFHKFSNLISFRNTSLPVYFVSGILFTF